MFNWTSEKSGSTEKQLRPEEQLYINTLNGAMANIARVKSVKTSETPPPEPVINYEDILDNITGKAA